MGSPICPDVPRLSNFKSGRVCTAEDGTQDVCKEQVDIDIDGDERCEFDGKTIRCNWFGYEFDYEGIDPSIPVKCIWERSIPSDEGNRDGVRQENAESGSTEFLLPTFSGHFVQPLFQNHAVPPRGKKIVIHTAFHCSYYGSPLFEVEYRFHFRP